MPSFGLNFGESPNIEEAKEDKPKETCLEIIHDISTHLTTLQHVLVIGVSAYVIYLCFPGPLSLVTWHVFLYTIGWIFLVTEGILFSRSENIFSSRLTQKWRNIVHWAIMLVATAFIIAGFIVIYKHTEAEGKNHFDTEHALPGAVATFSAYIVFVLGLPSFFCNKEGPLNPIIKICHVVLGLVAVLSGLVASATGFHTVWFRERSNANMMKICTVTVSGACLAVIKKPIINAIIKLVKLFRSN